MSDYAPGETLTRRFATVNASGPATLTGGAVAVFKGTSVTPITAGVTLALDDIATGSHLVTVDTSADVVYSAPSDYAIVITVGATDQSLVGQPIGGFRLVETTVEDLKLDHVQQNAQLTAIIAATSGLDVDIAAVLAAITTDTYALPGQQAPPATQTLVGMASYLYKFLRSKIEQNATEMRVFADDGVTVDHKAPASVSGGVFTRGEFTSGP